MNLKDLIKAAYWNGMSIPEIVIQYGVPEERVSELLGIKKIKNLFENEEVYCKRYIKLQCIRERSNWALTIRVGEIVYADITSLRIDSEGDAFMEVYNAFGKWLGNCNMKRFKSVT